MKGKTWVAVTLAALATMPSFLGENAAKSPKSQKHSLNDRAFAVAVADGTHSSCSASTLEEKIDTFFPPFFVYPAVPLDSLMHDQLREDAAYFKEEIKQWHSFMKIPEDSAVVINKNTLQVIKKFPNKRFLLRSYFRALKKQDPEHYQNFLLIRGRKEHVLKSLQRFTRYQIILQKPLEKRTLSSVYAIIPLIESHLQFPVSSAGAKGPWQLLAPLAKQYYLPINAYVDARNSLVDASEAAASYLQHLEQSFSYYGLALFAYIRGPVGVAQDLEAMLHLKRKHDLFQNYHTLLQFHQPHRFQPYTFKAFKEKWQRYKPQSKNYSLGQWIQTYSEYLKSITTQSLPSFHSYLLENLQKSPQRILLGYEKTLLQHLGYSWDEFFMAAKEDNAYEHSGNQSSRKKTSSLSLQARIPSQEETLEMMIDRFSQYLFQLRKKSLPSFFTYYHQELPEQSPQNVFRAYYHYLKNQTENNFATPNYPVRFLAYYLALEYPEWYGFPYKKEEPISVQVYETQRWTRLKHLLRQYALKERPIIQELNKHLKRNILPPGTRFYGITN